MIVHRYNINTLLLQEYNTLSGTGETSLCQWQGQLALLQQGKLYQTRITNYHVHTSSYSQDATVHESTSVCWCFRFLSADWLIPNSYMDDIWISDSHSRLNTFQISSNSIDRWMWQSRQTWGSQRLGHSVTLVRGDKPYTTASRWGDRWHKV